MLEINELQKTYRNGIKALDQVTLSVGRGMLGLLGPNGAGKSTLMRTLSTLQTPDSGSVFFDGIDILKNPVELRKLLGYLPQDFGVYPGISAQKLLHYFAVLKGITAPKDRKRVIEEVLEITNLSDVAGKDVDAFSGGMKQRFGIAQLLLNKPKFIIVDEPTAGLDPAERNRFLNLLREISVENTVIFSTHIVEDINDLCGQVAVLHHGKILLHESPSQAVEDVRGKIWTATIDKKDSVQATSKHMVLASKYSTPHSITIRVFSDNQPASDFTTAEPQLEDVYFAALATNGQPTAQPRVAS